MPVVNWGLYDEGRRQEAADYEAAVAAARRGHGFVWIGLHEPENELLHRVADDFGLHPLAVEDVTSTHENPKVEHYEESIFMVLKTVRYVPHEDINVQNEIIETGEVTVFIGSHFVVTVRKGDHGGLASIRSTIEDNPEMLSHGPAAVLYAIADVAVDGYLDVAEKVDTDITEIEESIFAEENTNHAERIYRIKRELLNLRRAVVPLGQPIRTLSQHPVELIDPKVQTYFRDIGDHLDRVHNLLAGYEDIINSMLQANLAKLSVAQNNDMRKITSWAAIIAVPTAIAGIYGMNFAYMPELRWTLGYPAALTLMALSCVALYWNFKRRGWL